MRAGVAEFSHQDGFTAFKQQGNLFALLLLPAQYLMSRYSRGRVLPLALLRTCTGLALWNPLLGHPGNRSEFPLKRFRPAARDGLSASLLAAQGEAQPFRIAHTQRLSVIVVLKEEEFPVVLVEAAGY